MKHTLLFLLLACLIMAGACTSEPEPESVSQPTVTQPAATEPPAANTATPTIAMPPTETEAPTSPATEEAPPTATPEPAFRSLGPLPGSQEATLTIVDQWGGVPRAMALDGATAYVGFGPRLLAVDVSEPGQPRLLGHSAILPDLISDLDVVGNLAYLAAGKAGLAVLDISDPAAMRVVSEGPNYADGQPANARSVIVDDQAALVVDFNRADGQTMLLHFDISDPAQISLLGSHRLPSNASVQVSGDLIVAVNTNELQLRDAAKPASIMSETPLAAGNYLSQAVVDDTIITVIECCGPSGIERFDVSDPYHPAALGPLQELELMPPSYAAAEGSLLATASIFGEFGFCQSTVNLIEIAGDSPQALTSFDPENCLGELVLDGDRLYLAGRSGLQIYDLNEPANPALLGQFKHPDGFHDAQGLVRRNGLTFALTAEGRGADLATLDLSEQSPSLTLDRQRIGQELLLDLFISGDTLIIPVWMGSLYTLDISDPAAPQYLHRPVEGELYSGDLFNMLVKGDLIYTPVLDGVSIGGIGTIDLSDPANPVLVSTVETGQATVLSLALGGDTLYVLSQGEQSQISLFDVSQPLAPEPITNLTLSEFVSRLAVVGDALYATCDGHNCQAVYAIDVADKQNPDVTSRWTIPFGVRDMVTDEQGTIYLITSEQRIVTMDGRDPAQLRLTGSLPLPGEFTRLKIEGDQIYAAAFDGGLYQIQIQR